MADRPTPDRPSTEAGRRMLSELRSYIEGRSGGSHWPLHSILAIEAEARASAPEQGEPPAAALRVEYYTGRQHGYEEGFRAASGAQAVPPLDVERQRIASELQHYDLSDDPGYIRVPTERVRAILAALHPESSRG